MVRSTPAARAKEASNSNCTLFGFVCNPLRQPFCPACEPREDTKEMLLDAESVAVPSSWLPEDKPIPISLSLGNPVRLVSPVAVCDEAQAPTRPSILSPASKRKGEKEASVRFFPEADFEVEAAEPESVKRPVGKSGGNAKASNEASNGVVMDNDNSIYIEQTYDFYSAQRHKMAKRNVMHTTAVHERRGRLSRMSLRDDPHSSGPLLKDRDVDTCSDFSDEDFKRSVSKSSASSNDSDGNGRDLEFQPSMTRTISTISRFDEDNVTNWAVIVGKFLNRRVLGIGISALAQEAVRHKRRSVRKPTYSTTVLPGVRNRAMAVLQQAKSLVSELAGEDDRFDHEWYEEGLLVRLFHRDYVDTILLLAKSAIRLIKEQPMVPEVSSPCRVFGDVHGQLRDLLLFFKAFGFPQNNRTNIIFNGDFVDRGRHQVEVMFLLLALKLAMPEQVYLVRGNHEDSTMNEKYGFRDEIMKAMGVFGDKTFRCIQQVFDVLPFAALVDGKALCVHGGIGDGKWNLNDLRSIKRPITSDYIRNSKMLMNILWSDPIEEDEGGQQVSSKETFGVHQSPRSSNMPIMDFGWNVTKTFCARNGLSLVIRSHQSKLDGHGFDLMHDRMLIRVFSARDYEGNGNDGAVLLLSPAEMQPPVTTPGGSQAPEIGLKARLQVVGHLTVQQPNTKK